MAKIQLSVPARFAQLLAQPAMFVGVCEAGKHSFIEIDMK